MLPYVRTAILLASAASVLPAQSTSLPTFWRYSHPEAKALVGINLKTIGSSPFGARLAREFAEAGFKAKAQAEGFDFISDTDRVLISSPGAPEGGAKDKAPFAAVLTGKYDLARIRSFVKSKGARRSLYKKFELLSPEDGPDFTIATVGPQTLVVGDPASVKAALDHHSVADPAASFNPLFQRAVELDTLYDIWFSSELPPSSLSRDNPMMAVLADAVGFEGGLSFRGGLGLEVHFNTASTEGAQKLAGGLQILTQMAAAGAEGKPGGPADLLKKLRIGSDATRVTLGMAFDQAEIDRGLDEVKASFRSGALPVTTASAPAEPEPAPVADPQKPLVVKIYNAVGGPREIPLNK